MKKLCTGQLLKVPKPSSAFQGAWEAHPFLQRTPAFPIQTGGIGGFTGVFASAFKEILEMAA